MTVQPTNVQPATGSTVPSDFPELVAYVPYGSGGAQENNIITWTVASDSGFTTDVQTIQTATRIASGNTGRAQVPVRLSPGTWYVRARCTDVGGTNSSWSATQSFTIAHLPNTSDYSPPATGKVLFGSGDVMFSWTFNDPNPGDVQTAYQVRAYRISDDALVFDTTKTASANQFHLETGISATYNSGFFYWQVRVWDFYDDPSPWSPPISFFMGANPLVRVIYPTSTVDSPNPTIQWAFSTTNDLGATYDTLDTLYDDYDELDAANDTYLELLALDTGEQANQQQYRVVITNGLLTVYDSGWVVGTASQHTLASPVLTLGPTYTVVVYAQDLDDFEGVSPPVNFTAVWDAPDAGLNVDADDDAIDVIGAVQVTWDPSAADPNFIEWRVYRRDSQIGDWVLLGSTSETFGNRVEFLDYTARANGLYEYAVVQVADRFGDPVESAYEAFPLEVNSTQYWLICPANPSLNCLLPNVTSESFSDNYEQAEQIVSGKGRRVEYGTRIGRSGSLTAQVRGIEGVISARDQRTALEALKDSRLAVVLRNPFGDLMTVAMGEMSVTRLAGVGVRELVDVTIPYLEVYEG